MSSVLGLPCMQLVCVTMLLFNSLKTLIQSLQSDITLHIDVHHHVLARKRCGH